MNIVYVFYGVEKTKKRKKRQKCETKKMKHERRVRQVSWEFTCVQFSPCH